MAKKSRAATKKTILMLTPATHLRLKVMASCGGLTMGALIKKLLDRVEPGGAYSAEDDLRLLNHLEQVAADEDAEASTKVGKLEIQEAAK